MSNAIPPMRRPRRGLVLLGGCLGAGAMAMILAAPASAGSAPPMPNFGTAAHPAAGGQPYPSFGASPAGLQPYPAFGPVPIPA